MTKVSRVERLRWRNVSDKVRDALGGRLKGLYGAGRDEEAFDNLAVDKQQALLLFVRRLSELGLWDSVRRVENVYGTSGVGMNFRAWPEILSKLQSRKDFTLLFARHKENTGGFLERTRRPRASLHFSYEDKGERLWAVHFDLYNPWSSPANALRHLFYEKIRGTTPDWRAVSAVFSEEKLF
ncbi:MAG TPA: hypothetical protein VGC66_08570 [Pyrinomonadaceae bacterium]